MNRLDKIFRVLSYLLSCIAMFCIFSIAILTTVDVSARFILGKSLEGSVEVCEILMVLATFLGLAWAEIANAHVRVDFLVLKLPPKIRLVVDIGAKCLTVMCLSLISYASVKIALAKYYAGEIAWAGTEQIVLWPARFGLGLGFTVFCILSILYLIKTFEKGNNRSVKEILN